MGRKNSLTGWELCSTDGNTISLVKDINSTFGQNSYPSRFRIVNNELFFQASDGNAGGELWKTDGTSQGTVLVKDVRPGNTGSSPTLFGEVNNKLVFRASDGTHGTELWTSDGTTQGTKLLLDIYTGSNSGAKSIKSEDHIVDDRIPVENNYNDILYFAADDGTNGTELWRTDGTDTGTYMVEQVGNNPNNTASSELDYIFIDSNNVWLAMSDGSNGIELYLYKAPLPPLPQTINDITKKQATLYPNPSSGNFTISIEHPGFLNGIVHVYDITGREIYNQSINRGQSQVPISLQHTPSGTYQVVLELDRHIETHKISIQH